MLKPLAIGLLTLSAACSTAAFADNDSFTPPQYTAGETWQEYVQIWWQDFEEWVSQLYQQGNQGGSGVIAAPEIDPASAIAALSLLAGGLAVMRGRRSSRKSA